MTSDKDYSQSQYDDEYIRFKRSPDWELANVRQALNLLPFLNTSQDWARLQAVKDIQSERRRRKRRFEKRHPK